MLSKKQIIFLVSLLILVVASLYFFVKSDFISDRIALIAKATLTPILHQEVTIQKSELTLFPPSVVVTEMASSGKLPIFIKRAQIYFSLWSLFTQSFFIHEIRIEEPTISFGPDVDIEPGLMKKSETPTVVIRRIRIVEGSLSYNAPEQKIFLPHLDATIEPNFNMDRFNVALSGKQGGVTFAKQEKRFNQLEAAFVADSDGIDITRASVQLDKTEMAVEGTVKGIPNLNLNLRMTATVPVEEVALISLSRPNLSGKMMLQGQVLGTAQNPTVTGRISIPHLFSKEGEVGSVGSDFSYKNNKGSFKNIVAKIFSGEGRGEATIHFPEGASFSEKGAYDLKWQYNHFSMDQAVTAFSSPAQGKNFYGLFLKGEVRLSGKGTGLDGIIGLGSSEIIREAVAPDVVTPAEEPVSQMEAWEKVVKAIPAAVPVRLFSLVTEGKLDWRKSEEGWQIQQGAVSTLQGKANVEGLFTPKDGVLLNTSLEMGEIKPIADILGVPITGKVYISGALTGLLDKPSFTGQMKLNHWTLLQRPFGALQSQLQYQDKTIHFREGLLKGLRSPNVKGDHPFYKFGGSFRLGQSSEPLAEAVPPAYNFTANAHSVEPQESLALFMKPIPLFTTATGDVVIKGIGKEFTVTGQMAVGEGSLYGERFTKGNVLLTVNEQEVRLQNIFLEKEDGSMTAEGEGAISYQGNYTLDVKTSAIPLQKIDLMASSQPNISGEMALTVRGKGSFKKPALNMVAKIHNLQYKEAAMASGTMGVHWQDENVSIVSSFPQKNFSLTADIGSQKPYPFVFQTHFAGLPIHSFLRETSRLASVLSGISIYAGGDLSGKGTFEKPEQADLTGALSLLSATWGDYWITNDGPIRFVAQKGDFLIEKGSFKGINTDLILSGHLAPFKNWGLIIKGSADLNLLRLFTPKVRAGSGVAVMDVRITDQWENPNIQGVLSLQKGLISLANFSDSISIAALSLVFNRHLLILETVSGKMGRGQFIGFGKATLQGTDWASFGVQFDLKEMPVRLTPDVETMMEGTLQFQGDPSSQLLDGALHVQKALYEKRIDLREMIVKWQESQEERLPIELPFAGTTRLSIHLSGKENIAVHNNIAKVPLEVDLFLKGTLEKPLLFGQIDIPKGTFSFRANEFKVTSGTVQFVNPDKIDPLFDIKGQSKVRDYAIDFSLAGTLSRFVLGLTSFPPLPDADILSLLALGKTTTEVVEAGGVATSIVSDFIAGILAEPVQQFTGLDKITVGVPGGKSSKSTLVSAEKRVLNDKILLVYSTAFDTAEQPKIQVFYELGKNVSLVGEKDEQGQVGGDLRFRFEFR